MSVKCAVCGRSKKPIGRDTRDNGLCSYECDGYRLPPAPSHYWDEELIEKGRTAGLKEAVEIVINKMTWRDGESPKDPTLEELIEAIEAKIGGTDEQRRYKGDTKSYGMELEKKPEKPDWEEQIDCWFKPRVYWPQSSYMNGETMITLNGKDAREVLKDFICTEIIEKFFNEVYNAFQSDGNQYENALKVKARWLKGE